MKMKSVLLIVVTFVLVGMSQINAQSNEPETVVIRMVESSLKPQIIITKPEGTVVSIPLEKIRLNYNNDKAYENNSVLLQSEINKWKKEGFKIDGVTHSVYGDNFFTIIIMSKDEKE